MRKVNLLLLLLLLTLPASCSEQKAPPSAASPEALADNEANRRLAAQKHLEAVPPQEMLVELSNKVVKLLPEKSQKPFLEVMQGKELQEATSRINMQALVKHFNVKEIKALTAFYGSAEGKTIRQKYGDYLADVMPQVNDEVIAALEKARHQVSPREPQGQVKPAEPKQPESQPKPAEPPAAPLKK